MKKQASSKKQNAEQIAEVVEQAVAQMQEAAQTSEPKKRKMVEFSILASIMEFATEKAQLLVFHNDKGEVVKCWLSKQLSYFVADADQPDKMICRLPAWLYYKSGLNNYFPVERWSQVAL